MNQRPILHVNNLSVTLAGKAVLKQVSFSVGAGQTLAITGASGSGKTTLLKALTGQCFFHGSVNFDGDAKPAIALIGQQHHFRNKSNLSSFYYQQRFNSSDAEDALTVNQSLLSLCNDQSLIDAKLQLLGIEHVKNAPLIQLSNGEHKRFQLAKALLQDAGWLLLDSPYTGLDKAARKLLDEILSMLIAEGKRILIVTAASEMPTAVTHVATLENGSILPIKDRLTFENERAPIIPVQEALPRLASVAPRPAFVYDDFSVAIKMIGAGVEYDDRKILRDINWEVRKGERWNVSGRNGSGKSTLLSLVNGDNPQAFASEIWLFDRRKGSGESIWDIKRRIGYVSPELHHYFDASASCFQVVASGLFDTIGLFRQLSASQEETVKKWMQLFQLDTQANRLFSHLSNGEQRLILLARALVKNPPLLILDEPCQGLDADTAARFISLVNEICVKLEKTLVYVSHYEAEIPPCVTHTLKLEHGSIAA